MDHRIDNICCELSNLKLNKGYGAGGKNTNKNGLSFENKTNNERNLQGYIKNPLGNSKKQYYLSKIFENKTIIYCCQSSFKKFIKQYYDINLFRHPDEAYIIKYNNGKIIVKILEKKFQNVEGSVETKLWSALGLLEEYKILFGNEFTVQYAFCVSNYLQVKLSSPCDKYKTLNKIFQKKNIKIFFGDDENYFEKINNWIEHNELFNDEEWIYGS